MKTVLAAALAAMIAGAAAAPAALADRFERWFYVVNESGATVMYVYATDVGRGDWGPDLLGDDVIPSGYEMRVEPTRNRGYCKFDIRIDLDGGAERVLNDVNLCEITHVVVTRRGLQARY